MLYTYYCAIAYTSCYKTEIYVCTYIIYYAYFSVVVLFPREKQFYGHLIGFWLFFFFLTLPDVNQRISNKKI